MQDTLKTFYRVITDYTDLRWAKTRDDLISKIIKVLRAFSEGKDIQDVLAERSLSAEVENSLSYLYEFSQKNKEELDKLISALGIFVRSPAPCKMTIIRLAEVLLEDRRDTKVRDF